MVNLEGQRNTRQKQLLLGILKEADRPMSINELHVKLSAQLPKIAKSTIYRNIDSLLAQNLIDKYHLNNDNEVYYKIKADINDHKHYVICDNCKATFPLPSCPIRELENAMEEKGFIIKDHQIQINGLCKNCAEKYTVIGR